jgi:iron complex transport system ATP-binding protein
MTIKILPPVLEMKNVTVIQGDRNKKVLDAVSLTVPAGENVAILGPNGAGKTSLIRTITREYYPAARRNPVLRVMGEDHWNLFELRNLLGIVSSGLQSACAREMPGIEMVLSGFFGGIGLHQGQRVTAGMRKKAEEVLRFLEIAHLKDRSMSVMSSGEARRFLIGRAIIHDPKVLILDEPTNGLDLRATHHFKKMIRKIVHAGASVILVTQNLQDIIPEISRVVLMKEGKIVKDGPKKDVLTRAGIRALFNVPVEVCQKDGYFYALGH